MGEGEEEGGTKTKYFLANFYDNMYFLKSVKVDGMDLDMKFLKIQSYIPPPG